MNAGRSGGWTRRGFLARTAGGGASAALLFAPGCAQPRATPGSRAAHDPAAASGPLRVAGTCGPCRVEVHASDGSARWHYRIPETLSCDEGVFKVYYHPTVSWNGPDAYGSVWHEWQTSDQDLEALETNPRAAMYGPVFIQGIRYRVTITPSARGLDVTVRGTNVGGRTFHNVTAFPCLGHPSENYRDEELKRTFVVTSRGLTPACELERGTVDPRRTHFRVAGQPEMPFCNKPFWGESAPTAIERGVIARVRDDGRFTLATGWERVAEVFYNEDPHHCIHAVPIVGDLRPGESADVRGRIVLVAGGPEAALAALVDLSPACVARRPDAKKTLATGGRRYRASRAVIGGRGAFTVSADGARAAG